LVVLWGVIRWGEHRVEEDELAVDVLALTDDLGTKLAQLGHAAIDRADMGPAHDLTGGVPLAVGQQPVNPTQSIRGHRGGVH